MLLADTRQGEPCDYCTGNLDSSKPKLKIRFLFGPFARLRRKRSERLLVRRLLVRHGHDAPVRSALARLRDKAESIARYPAAYSMCPLTRRMLAASESVLHISKNARRARAVVWVNYCSLCVN